MTDNNPGSAREEGRIVDRVRSAVSRELWSRLYRRRPYVVVLVLMIATAAAYIGAFLIRFDFSIPEQDWAACLRTLPYLLIARIACYVFFGTVYASFRHSGLRDVWDSLKAQASGSVIFVAILFFLRYDEGLSRSVFVLEFVLSVIALSGIRFLRKFLLQFKEIDLATPRKHLLIVGAGDAGVIILNEIKQNQNLDTSVIGFVDDNPFKWNTYVQGYPVLGSTQEMPGLIRKYKIDEVVIAIPSAPYRDIMNLARIAGNADVSVKVLPGIGKLIETGPFLGQLNDVSVDRLMGRRSIKFSRETDRKAIAKEVEGRTVLVTGAGGSIGSEICRQLMEYHPGSLVALERHENSMYDVENELRKEFPDRKLVPVVCDIRDSAKIDRIIRDHAVEIIYHAAAYKHVPMMEREPVEAVRNNVFGTLNLAQAALAHGVRKFVLISTDKAVKPSSVMGTTKRVGERILQAHHGGCTQFISVRFGNVLDSSGSVIPLFKKQIICGGPITVTHKDVTRYFMSIPEAVQLVLTAGSMGTGGEIFLLDMGEPIKILDLARNLIVQAGLKPDQDIEIVFTGLRDGEKLHEELYWRGEGIVPTGNKKITMLKPDLNTVEREELVRKLAELRKVAESDNHRDIVPLLRELVPEATIGGASSSRVPFGWKPA